MGWYFERLAPNTDLTHFMHPVYGQIPRFSRINGRITDLGLQGAGFGNDGMHFIYRITKTANTNIDWLDASPPPNLQLDILLSPDATDDNAQVAFNANGQFNDLHGVAGQLNRNAVVQKFGTNGNATFDFHTEIINYHNSLDLTIEEFKSMEHCAFKPLLSYRFLNQDAVPIGEGDWEWGYTKTCDKYFEGMTIEGPSESSVDWGGATTIEFTWNPGPVWMVEPPQVTGATFVGDMLANNLPYSNAFNNHQQMDLYKPRFNNFDTQYIDFGGAGGVFINIPTDTLTDSTFINWDNAFTDWNRGALTNDFLFSTTIDGLWYGDYFDSGNTLATTTIDELANNLKTPWYGDVTLVDPQTGPEYGWGYQPENYVATDYFLDTPTQTAFPANLFQIDELNSENYAGGSYSYLGVEILDDVGNLISYDNLYGIEVTDNFQPTTLGGAGGVSWLTSTFDHRFTMTYQHNGEAGSLQSDKFYIFLWSATGHYAIKTVNINIGLDPGFYDDLLIPYEEDLWVDVPEIDYNPTDDGTTIQRPPDILYHLFEIEMGYTGGINEQELEEARMVHANFDEQMFKMGFSIKDEMKGIDLVSQIAQESYCLPTLTNNKLGLKLLKPTYTGQESYIVPITHSSIISMQSERESTANIITRLKTYYDFNPSTENYVKDIPALTIGSSYLLPAYDPGYYNLKQIEVNSQLTYDHTKYTKNVELRLIRDTHTALEWTVTHLLDNCQPHNLLTITLPLRYCFLELGDVLRFPEGPFNNENILGEDYSRLVVRNGQYILPLFIIHDIEISDTVKVRCRQLHHNKAEELIFDGQVYVTITGESASWDGTNPDTGEPWDDGGYLGPPDIDTGGGDVGGPGSGDGNGDGVLDILDVVPLVAHILDGGASQEELDAWNTNQDSNIDVLDVIQIVSWILDGLGPYGEPE